VDNGIEDLDFVMHSIEDLHEALRDAEATLRAMATNLGDLLCDGFGGDAGELKSICRRHDVAIHGVLYR
jgi:hypothetical protein